MPAWTPVPSASRRRRMNRLAVFAALALLVCGWAAWVFAAGQGQPLAGIDLAGSEAIQLDPNAVAELTGADGRMHFFVELDGIPAARAWAARLADFGEAERNSPAARAAAAAEARRQVQENRSAQSAVEGQLLSGAIGAQEIYRLAKVANGFVVRAEPGKFAAMNRLAGVRAVRVVHPEEPTNSTSVPFIAAPPAWGDTLGLGINLTGAGVSIGVIDTGIDYLHTHFGGSGVLADYQANDRTVAPDAYFPTVKVVGGRDFAGDTYNAGGNGGTTGSTTPAPDPDPMDCNRHGTHVAGTAAGYGVNADGSTYSGLYGPGTPFAGMRIGPGVAPGASLYALRVFGCTGSTVVTAQAIEWSTDPNGDDDFSDHLDIINMSLGSNHGSVNDLSAQASESAALVGVVVVTSAGNAGDTHFITGSPGAASRALSVAASQDSGLAGAWLTVNSPPAIAGGYAAAASAYTDPTPPPPPVASGQTANVVLVDDGSVVGPGTVNDACQAPINAAAIAGNIALTERGGCNFNVKVQNLQAAGAIGVIVANNVAGDPVPNVMGGAATIEITIPAISVAKATGDAIRAQLASGVVNVTLNGGNAGDTIAAFSSRGPRRASSPIKLKPEIIAPGLNITSSQTGISSAGGSCVPTCPVSFANAGANAALLLSGTSMAAPHLAGVMAIFRQEHPSWSVEEMKALAMNYANHDTFLGAGGSGPRFGPGRVGSGRVDVAQAVVGRVIAMSKDDPGLVAVTFEAESVGTLTADRTIRVVNHGTSPQTYDLAVDAVIDAPGVALSLPDGATVSVPAGGTAEFRLRLTATSSAMDAFADPTLAAGQAVTAPAGLMGLGAVARHKLTEETGYVTFSQGGGLRLRVPYYSAPRPASAMAGATITTGGAPTGSTAIALSGTGVCTGTLGAGPACTGTFPTDVMSAVTPFELQLTSPRNPDLALVDAYGDIQHVGVAADAAGTNIFFGVSSWSNWSSPNETVYNIWIDNNEDGTWDRVVFNGSLGQVSARVFGSANDFTQDNYMSFIFTPPGTITPQAFINGASPANFDTHLHDSGVQMLVASAATLGLTAGNNDFRYRVESCPWSVPLCSALPAFVPNSGIDSTGAGVAYWSRTARGLDFGGNFLIGDLNGGTVPVTWNTANLTTNGSLGGLLLHHHNASGNQAQVVLLDTAQRADLAIAKSMAPAVAVFGQSSTFTVTLTNNGPNTASGIVVLDALPSGLSYVSDNGAGAYDSNTGVWTVPGSLANGASASLQVVATVETTEAVENTATISSATPLDTDPSDNRSTVVVNAAEVADIELDMSVSSPTVNAGGSFDVTLIATNNGGDTGFSLAVAELFTGFEPLAPTASVPSDGVYDPATGIWNVASLASGDDATLVLTFTAPNMAGVLTNNGAASSGVADSNNANNTASASITVLSPATVTATKTVSGSFVVGGTVTYTVTLANSSSFAQQNNPGNEFTDVLPGQLTLVSASATGGTATATVGTNTVTWNGAIPGSGSVTITITATIDAGSELQSVSNQGTTSTDADGNGVNEASGLTDDPGVSGAANPTVFIVGSPATLTATKAASAGPYNPGGAVSYQVVITNGGSSQQANNPGNEFTDVLPAQLDLVSATATGGTAVATVGTNTVTWNGSLAAGASVTITINATIDAGTAGASVSNQGTLSFDADGNGSNEATGATDDPAVPGAANPTVFIVGSPATLAATKAASAGPYNPGGAVSYQVVITNNGVAPQNDNPGNEFTDVLPAQLDLVSATATGGIAVATVGTNTVTWNGSLAAGASVTITINATIDAGAAGASVSNQGTLSFDADGNGSNEATGATDDPAIGGVADPTVFVVGSPAVLSGTKVVTSSGPYLPGSLVTYELVITNGSANLHPDNPGDELVDILPPELNLVGATASSGVIGVDFGTNTVTWNGALAGGASVTIEIEATIGSLGGNNTITNQGTIHFDADGNGTNESTGVTDDPGVPGGADGTDLIVGDLLEVPTLSQLGLLAMALLLAGAAWLAIRRS